MDIGISSRFHHIVSTPEATIKQEIRPQVGSGTVGDLMTFHFVFCFDTLSRLRSSHLVRLSHRLSTGVYVYRWVALGVLSIVAWQLEEALG